MYSRRSTRLATLVAAALSIGACSERPTAPVADQGPVPRFPTGSASMARPVQPPPPNAVYIASWEMSSKRIALGTEGTAYTITIGNTTGAPQVEMYVQAYLTQGGIIDEAGGGTITLCPNEPPGTIPVGGCTFDYAVYPFLGSLTAGQAILELELFDFDRGGTGQNTTLDTRSMKVRLVAP